MDIKRGKKIRQRRVQIDQLKEAEDYLKYVPKVNPNKLKKKKPKKSKEGKSE